LGIEEQADRKRHKVLKPETGGNRFGGKSLEEEVMGN